MLDDQLLFIIQSQKIYYARFDPDLILKEYSPSLKSYLDLDHVSFEGCYLTDIFQELVGYEHVIDGILKNGDSPLKIDIIRHPKKTLDNGDLSDSSVYYSLSVHSYQAEILTIIRDVTEEVIVEQRILQRRNELDLINARLIDDLRKANAELNGAYEYTLEGWAKALELRDYETKGHSERVTQLVMQLTRSFGVAENQLIHIRYGSLLHDIGKMGVPDSILLKPGPLTDAEWVVMRQHPEYAHHMLKSIDHLSAALDIPLSHHEKWDGTGYPFGLKGEQIPIGARIFSVIDVWDALTSNRPYRSAWTSAQAAEYIRFQKGRHFDPEVVEAFLKIIASSYWSPS